MKFWLLRDQDLAENVLHILSLTQVSIKQDNIAQYHRPRKKTHGIVKLEEYQEDKIL